MIRAAAFPADTATVLALWRAFVAGSPVDLSYQDNAAEFAALPGRYASPAGCVLLAGIEDVPVGCVAMRPCGDGLCEMKRLYVRPSARGGGLGRELVAAVVGAARAAGHRAMRLDVMAPSLAARALYREAGFVDAPPVSINPVPGASFLGLEL